MNIFLKIITSLGFLTVITQFLGIPHSWKEVITVIIGVAVMLVAFFIDRITLFLQKREDGRYQEAPSHSGTRQTVSPFSTSLSTVTEAFSEVSQATHTPAPLPTPAPTQTNAQPYREQRHMMPPPAPSPVPASHAVVPQSHTHVQEMAHMFQRQTPQAAPTLNSTSATSTPPTPAAAVPKPVSPPQPIQASRYSSTPLSSLNAPAVALRINHEDDEDGAEQKSVVKTVPVPPVSTPTAIVEKKKAVRAPKKTKINVAHVAPVEEPAPVKPKSRKKPAAPKVTKEE